MANRKKKEETIQELKKGFMTQHGLSEFWNTDEVKFLKNLMEHTDFLIDTTEQHDEQHYLIPCMLSSQNVNMDKSKTSSEMLLMYDALHRQAEGDRLLIGSFHQLLSRCSKLKGLKLDWNPKKAAGNLSYTNASFSLGQGMKLTLTLSQPSEVRARIWCPKDIVGEDLSEELTVCKKIREDLAATMKKLKVKPDAKFLLHCPHFDSRQKKACLVDMKEYIHPTPKIISYGCNKAASKCPGHKLPLRRVPDSLLIQATGRKYTVHCLYFDPFP